MKIAVVGAGSVGCYVGGALIAAGADVSFFGREYMAAQLAANGISLTDYRGRDHRVAAADIRFMSDPDMLVGFDLLLITVKSAATESIGDMLASRISKDCTVISLQNGVDNAESLRSKLPNVNVVAGMVGFNVLSKGDGHFHAGTEGEVMVGHFSSAAQLGRYFSRAGVSFYVQADMTAVLWSKLLLNLNNPINALCGLPLQQELSQRSYRRCLALLQEEALAALKAAGQPLVKLTGVPTTLLPTALRLPDWLFTRFAKSMLAMDPTARSSMWEDFESGRTTEVLWLNGAVVKLAAQQDLSAKANERLIALVEGAEKGGRRDYSGAELLAELSA